MGTGIVWCGREEPESVKIKLRIFIREAFLLRTFFRRRYEGDRLEYKCWRFQYEQYRKVVDPVSEVYSIQ